MNMTPRSVWSLFISTSICHMWFWTHFRLINIWDALGIYCRVQCDLTDTRSHEPCGFAKLLLWSAVNIAEFNLSTTSVICRGVEKRFWKFLSGLIDSAKYKIVLFMCLCIIVLIVLYTTHSFFKQSTIWTLRATYLTCR